MQISKEGDMRYLKKILPVILTLIVTAGMLYLVSILTTPKCNTQDAGHDAWAAYGFEAEPADSLDVFLLGDSESRTSISPMELFHNDGFTSYCSGINSNTLCEVSSMLHLILDFHHPKLMILECNVIFAPFTWQDAFETVASDIFPVVHWHNRWKTLKKEDFTSLPHYDNVEVRKGYYHSTNIDPAPPYLLDAYMIPGDEREELPGINRWYLEHIISVCKKHGIEVMMLSMPSTKNWSTKKHNTCADIAEAQDIPFVDLNEMREEVPIDWSQDTRDRGDHLNNSGMRKVCAWLGPWLKETYQLEDHREDNAYKKNWTDLYDEYMEWIS